MVVRAEFDVELLPIDGVEVWDWLSPWALTVSLLIEAHLACGCVAFLCRHRGLMGCLRRTVWLCWFGALVMCVPMMILNQWNLYDPMWTCVFAVTVIMHLCATFRVICYGERAEHRVRRMMFLYLSSFLFSFGPQIALYTEGSETSWIPMVALSCNGLLNVTAYAHSWMFSRMVEEGLRRQHRQHDIFEEWSGFEALMVGFTVHPPEVFSFEQDSFEQDSPEIRASCGFVS